MADNELQKKEDQANELRQQIKDERAQRARLTQEASEARAGEELDAEIARLQTELEAERALTEAQEAKVKGDTQESSTATPARTATKPVAQHVADDTKQNKEN